MKQKFVYMLVGMLILTIVLSTVGFALAKQERVCWHHESQGVGDPSWTKWMPVAILHSQGHPNHAGDGERPASDCGEDTSKPNATSTPGTATTPTTKPEDPTQPVNPTNIPKSTPIPNITPTAKSVDPTPTDAPTQPGSNTTPTTNSHCPNGDCVYVINVNINSLEDLKWLPTAVATLKDMGYECWNGGIQIK